MEDNKGWNYFSKEIIEKIDQFAPQAELMPGVVVLNRVGDFSVVYMSNRGLQQLNISLKELQEMKTEYHSRYFNIDDLEDFMPKLNRALQNKDPDENFTFFQQVKFAQKNEWVWHLTCSRIFAFDQEGNPLLIVSHAIPVQDMKHMPEKGERLQKEISFLKQNVQQYASLGAREKEVLKWIALSFSSKEIAEKLHISVDTVNTHRKNIKRKLNISTPFEHMEYARTFDLI